MVDPSRAGEETLLQQNLKVIEEKSLRPTCHFYGFSLHEHADAAFKETAEFKVSIKALYLRLSLEDKTPFSPDALSRFTDDECQLLYAMRSQVSNPEIAARLCDILWLLKKPAGVKPFELGLEACRHYFESAKRQENESGAVDGSERMERALGLAYTFRRSPNKPLAPILAHLKQIIESPPLDFLRHVYLNLICSRAYLDEAEIDAYVEFTDNQICP